MKKLILPFRRYRCIGWLFGYVVLAASAHATLISPPRVPMPDCIPQQAVADATDLGPVSPDANVNFAFVLPWRNHAALDDFLQRLYNPSDPLYGHYLTPQSFTDRFGPDPADVQAVVDYAKGQGLSVTSVSSNRLVIDVSGPASVFESALDIPIEQYQATNGDTFLAPVDAPSLPASLAARLLGIAGFGDHTLQPHYYTPFALGTGSGPQGTIIPSDIRTGYGLEGSPADGSGQTLGLVELSGYYVSDVTAYEKAYNITPAVPLQNVYIDGFSGAVSRRNTGGASEAALDIEMMTALAPRATQILVYEMQNGKSLLDMFNRMVSDNLATAISSSWGEAETLLANSDLKAEDAVFQEMAAQGQTFFSAAGDNGAYDDGRRLSVDDPASQPYVTGVGGTTLTLLSSGAYAKETTWNDLQTNNPGAGGGGVSAYWSIPSWQADAITPATKGSTTMRNVPDVSFNAGTPYAIYAIGQLQPVGGTSCAAPLWAAFTALVNQMRSANGLPRVGFLNPILYKIGAGARAATDFHDIADGTNNGYFPATPGYDDATGWGSFNGAELLADISAKPAQAVVAGDLNGDGKVNLADASLALGIAVGQTTPTAAQLQAGDVAKNGKIDLADVIQILQLAVGLSATVPNTTT